MTRTSPRSIVILVVLAFVVVLSLPGLLSVYIDWLWFENLGFGSLFTGRLNAQLLAAIAGGLLGFLIPYANAAIALRLTRGRTIVTQLFHQVLPEIPAMRYLDKAKLLVSLPLGIFIAALFSGHWYMLLSFLNASEFGHADPVFGKDASFYVFALPVFEVFSQALSLLLWVSLIVSAFVYLFRGAVFIHPRGISAENSARAHLAGLGSLIFLILAFDAYIEMHSLILSAKGLFAGATYTDVHARIPFLKAKIFLGVLTAGLMVIGFVSRKNLVIAGGVLLYVATAFVGDSVYPAILQKFFVAPNEFVKETPYIRHNISATRHAFGIAEVEERNLSGRSVLTAEDISKNATTIENIRLWDHRPLLDTFSQIQEIRTYYDFASVDNDRYIINGGYRQTMLSARELATESIPTRNWINETLTFTHGYGVTLGPVNQVTPEGLPVLFVKDIPPVSLAGSPRVSRPEIYFGELSSQYVIVNTKAKEFDYPSGEENVFSVYGGKQGVVIDSLLKRLAFAFHFRSMKLLLSDDVTGESRILFERNITTRIRKLMPFLQLDGDPYMVIADDGSLFWICDAYTVSGRFPYAQRLRNGVNYIRNSVKATINAYDGRVTFYVADEHDPLVRTIAKAFPGSLRPLSEMPEDLRRHIRYPQDIFGIQTAVYSTYHMEDPQIFYNREDQWEIPVMGAETGGEAMEPYYTIMRLPGEKGEEFILMLPFTPKKKQNLAAWMVARSDGEKYGGLVVYRFPKDRLVYGPRQIVARINQDTEISRQISLWDQRGSQVIQGTLLVIPIEESLIYVQPLYLRAETGKIPELKRVIVAHENRIAMEESLEAALGRIFGGAAAPRRPAPQAESAGVQPPAEDFGARAQAHFERAMKAQREGDWALYGEEIKKLGEIIRRMQR